MSSPVSADYKTAPPAEGRGGDWGRDHYWQSTGFPSGTFFDLATGDDFGCAIRTNQTLECWGHNVFGKTTPPSGSFIEVAASSSYACARRTDDVIVCWGNF